MENKDNILRKEVDFLRHVVSEQAQIIRNMRDKVVQIDSAWLKYTSTHRGAPEDKWALEKMLALFNHRDSRWW